MTERGVSNTLGYVLLFAIVIFSLTVVGTLGVESLENARDGTVEMNAEHSMTGVANALENIHRENVTRRSSQFGLGQGQLRPGDTTEVTVTLDGTDVVDETEIHPLVYESGDTQLVYEAGAVFRLQDSGGLVLREPNFVLENDATILPFVLTNASSPDSSVGGSDSQVTLTRRDGDVSHETGFTGDVEIEIETTDSRADLWRDMLNDEITGGGGCSISGSDTVECTHSPNPGSTVIVRTTTVAYELSV